MKKSHVDTLAVVGLLLLGIVARIPFRSHVLYHWDSVNFALAVERYDVGLHQPHPPGYILYVMLGRLVNLLIRDPAASLVWISVVFSGFTAAAIFHLGKSMYGKDVGIITALLFITSPAFWFYGEVALSYITEAFFVTIFAYTCYKLLIGDNEYVVISALVLGIAGGFRQNTLFLLAPLWLFSLRKYPWKKIALAFLALAIVVGTWFALMVVLTGGIDKYLQATVAQAQSNVEGSSLLQIAELGVNALRIAVYTFYALSLGLILLACWAARQIPNVFKLARDERVQVLFGWVIPSVLFYTLFIRHPGHTFTFMPALLIVLALAIVELGSSIYPSHFGLTNRQNSAKHFSLNRVGLVITVLLVVGNTCFFLLVPPYLFGYKKVIATTPGWRTIRHRDQYLSGRFATIREHFSPITTAVLAGSYNFRHPDYYLRDYQLTSLSYKVQSASEIVLPGNVRTLVLFDEDLNEINENQEVTEEVILPSGDPLYYLSCQEDQEIVVTTSSISLRDAH